MLLLKCFRHSFDELVWEEFGLDFNFLWTCKKCKLGIVQSLADCHLNFNDNWKKKKKNIKLSMGYNGWIFVYDYSNIAFILMSHSHIFPFIS